MAENENGQEQSEEPTAKRLRDAREKGQVARSREFNTLVILIAGGAYFKFLGNDFATDLMTLLKEALTFDRRLVFETELLVPHLQELMTRAMLIIAPLFLLMMTTLFVKFSAFIPFSLASSCSYRNRFIVV